MPSRARCATTSWPSTTGWTSARERRAADGSTRRVARTGAGAAPRVAAVKIVEQDGAGSPRSPTTRRSTTSRSCSTPSPRGRAGTAKRPPPGRAARRGRVHRHGDEHRARACSRSSGPTAASRTSTPLRSRSPASTKDEVIGRNYWDVFIDPVERRTWIERFEALAPDFPAGEYENAFTNARGEQRVVYWRTAPVRDETGDVVSDRLRRRRHHRATEARARARARARRPDDRVRDDAEHHGRARTRRHDPRPRRRQPERRRQPRLPRRPSAGGRRDRRATVPRPRRRGRRRPCRARDREGGCGERPRWSSRSCAPPTEASRAFAWSAIPVADVTGRMDGSCSSPESRSPSGSGSRSRRSASARS